MKTLYFIHGHCELIGRDDWDYIGGIGTLNIIFQIARSVITELQELVRKNGINSL